jgi:hypothetical protein
MFIYKKEIYMRKFTFGFINICKSICYYFIDDEYINKNKFINETKKAYKVI